MPPFSGEIVVVNCGTAILSSAGSPPTSRLLRLNSLGWTLGPRCGYALSGSHRTTATRVSAREWRGWTCNRYRHVIAAAFIDLVPMTGLQLSLS